MIYPDTFLSKSVAKKFLFCIYFSMFSKWCWRKKKGFKILVIRTIFELNANFVSLYSCLHLFRCNLQCQSSVQFITCILNLQVVRLEKPENARWCISYTMLKVKEMSEENGSIYLKVFKLLYVVLLWASKFIFAFVICLHYFHSLLLSKRYYFSLEQKISFTFFLNKFDILKKKLKRWVFFNLVSCIVLRI